MAASAGGEFLKPSSVERAFNRVVGWLVAAGFGFYNSFLLEVVGRKSSRVYATPVHLLEIQRRVFLVCPRGRAQWVINAEASGQVWLRRGRVRMPYSIRPVALAEKPELLRAYLDRFRLTVQRYFPMPAGSPANEFAAVAGRYPVFELTPTDIGDPVQR
jgi:deazaflavin-dependent oxidoreductase (nitroreductase family)